MNKILYIYNLHTIISIIYNNIYKVIKIYYNNLKSKNIKLIKNHLKFSKIKMKYIKKNNLIKKKHKGIVCKINYKVNLYSIKKIINMKKIILIGLYKPNDINNIGSCLRTINAAGADGIILFKKKININQGVIDISMGVTTPIFILNNFFKSLIKLKKMKIKIIYLNEKCKINLFKNNINFNENILFLIGGEKEGIKNTFIKNLCDYNIAIPMKGNINSLNITNVSTVCLYETIRKRYYNN